MESLLQNFIISFIALIIVTIIINQQDKVS